MELCLKHRTSRAAAQFAFYMTLSVFPMLICLNAMFGNLLNRLESIIELAENVVPGEALQGVVDYLSYVSQHRDRAMLTGGLILMASTSSAAFRALHSAMGELAGEPRFRGLFMYIASFLFSVVFLAVTYFAVAVVVTGRWFLQFIDDNIVFISVSETWEWLRFILLHAILLVILYILYNFTSPRRNRESLLPGAAAASCALVAVSVVFSWFIGFSSRYPLVYGSLASVIIMMVWLQLCGNIIIFGSAINAVLSSLRVRSRIILYD